MGWPWQEFNHLAGTELVLSAKHAMYVWRCDYHWCCCRVLRCQMCMAVCALQLGCWVLAASVISAEESMAKLWFSQPRKVEARMFQTSNRCKKLRGERWKGDLYTGYFFLGGVVVRPIVAKHGQTHVSFTERHTHTTVRKRRASSVLGRFPLPSFFRRNDSGGFAQQSIRLFQAHVEIVF